MKIYLIVLAAIILFSLHQVQAHDDEYDHAQTSGGPCWIWEVPIYPVYCIFTDGSKQDHPNPFVEPQPQ